MSKYEIHMDVFFNGDGQQLGDSSTSLWPRECPKFSNLKKDKGRMKRISEIDVRVSKEEFDELLTGAFKRFAKKVRIAVYHGNEDGYVRFKTNNPTLARQVINHWPTDSRFGRFVQGWGEAREASEPQRDPVAQLFEGLLGGIGQRDQGITI